MSRDEFFRPTNFDNKHWRRVISQLREIFNDLHKQIEINTEDGRFKDEQFNLSELCLNASEKYINVIEKELKLIKNNEAEPGIEESFNLILLVWKLCQIIFIKSSPSGALLVDLQEWYQSTNNIHPMIQDLFSSYKSNMADIFKDQNYWLLVTLAVAQGKIDTARHLLSFHKLKNSSTFKSIDELLRSMPNLSSLTHLSLFEFKAKWEYWQKKCIQVLTTEDFSIEDTGTLEILCKMLCADENTFINLKDLYGSWYYMLISYISYSNPTFNITDLHMLIETGPPLRVFEGQLTEFDLTIKSIFDFDINTVIKHSVQLYSNNLFSAHLLDILYLSGKLQLNKNDQMYGAYEYGKRESDPAATSNSTAATTTTESADLLYEQHLVEYGIQLAESYPISLSMYQTAFDYFIKCKNLDTKGIELIETYLQKIPLTYMSESDAHKVFLMSYQYGLHDLAFSIGRIMQTRALKRENYGTSLAWNCKIKDTCFGDYLAEKIFEKFIQTEDINLLDLTESVTKDIIYSDRLIFLSKYRDFYRLIKDIAKVENGRNENLKRAGEIIIALLEAPKLIPIKYRKLILHDVRLLVHENVLSEDQLFSILRIVQNYENRKSYFKDETILAGEEESNSNRSGDDSSSSNEVQMIENKNEDAHRRTSSIMDKFDQKKWNEFLNELSKRVAESFLLKSAEL